MVVLTITTDRVPVPWRRAMVIWPSVETLMTRPRERGKAFLMVGLADEDPLLPVVRRWLHVTYRSDLFTLAWDGARVPVPDGRIPRIEIATL